MNPGIFVPIAAVFLIAGLVTLTIAVRHQKEQRPRYAAMLIAGMMATAFGLVLGGFAVAYSATKPLDFNTTAGSAG